MYVKKTRHLDPWLNLASLMPASEKLPPLERASPRIVEELNHLWSNALVDGLVVPPLTMRTPAVMKNDPGIAHQIVSERYELFRRVREALAAITEVVNDRTVKRPESSNELAFDGNPPRISNVVLPPSGERVMVLTGGGIVSIGVDPYGMFLHALEMTGSDVWSLQACPVCGNPFLPRREDQKACSPNCANTFRVRRSRQPKTIKRRSASR